MNKIIVTVENHNCVFTKIKENDDEIIFYNTDYFKRIGFPDAEVSIGSTRDAMSDNVDALLIATQVVTGGYYDKPEELTYPFRHLVYLVQGTEKRKSTSKPKPFFQLNNYNIPDFFERLGTYGKQASDIISNSIEKAKPYFEFKTTTEPKETQPQTEQQSPPEEKSVQEQPPAPQTEQQPVPEKEVQEQPPQTEQQPVPEKEVQEQPPQTEQQPIPEEKAVQEQKQAPAPNLNMQYYKVTIPIIPETNKVPFGKFEKDELMLDYLLLENKVEKSLGKSKSGKIYKVGSRYIRMCEEVKDFSPLKPKQHPLIGTKMHKFGKFQSQSLN
jgi:hypothetical protein